MKVYLNPHSIGQTRFDELKKTFPSVEFIEHGDLLYEVEVAIIMPDFFKHHDINRFHQLKWVQLLMAGYDNFDFSGFAGKQIVITNAVDIFSTSIAEDVLTKILVLNRNVKHYLESMKQAIWEPIRMEPELIHKTIGIIGTGSIGREVAKRMKSFDMFVIGYRRTLEKVLYFDEIFVGNDGLKKVISESDYLVLAVPLTNDTMNLMNQESISWMKPDALLINVARGKIVDQEALYEALYTKKIRGAGLDVTTPEPLPKDHPLWKLENVFITPHNASSSPYMQPRLYQLIIHNLHRYLNHQKVDYIVYENSTI